MATAPAWTLRTIDRIDAVDPAAWDRLATPRERPASPFLTHRFLLALERSGSATRETGWQPFHLLLEDETGTLRGALPNYLKSHSQGEYIFDYAWAEAFQRAGGQYYPKAKLNLKKVKLSIVFSLTSLIKFLIKELKLCCSSKFLELFSRACLN